MEIYRETLDPSETKDYAWDWSSALADGETVASQVVTFINSAGTTNPLNSLASPISKVWLSGGTHGQRVIYSIVVKTNQGRDLDVALAVDVVDNAIGPEPQTALERLQAHREKLLDAKDEAVGGTVVEVWNGRYGNKMKYQAMSYEQICTALERVEREIAGEQAILAGRGRRAPVSLIWNN